MAPALIDPLLGLAQKGCDRLFELRHFPEPASRIARPALIAHRGAWNLKDKRENTLPAFHEARRLGAWGIELDLRFCRSGEAVVNHDPDLKRCYGREAQLCHLELNQLPKEVCLLEDVLALSDLHFMIEIKETLEDAKMQTLRSLLKHLRPETHYHLLTLKPELVRLEDFLPARAWILVGEVSLAPLVSESLRRGLGGVAGHYLGLTQKMIDQLHAADQKAGIGFTTSPNLFRREWSRGVDWVFTNTLERLVSHP